MTEPTQDSAAAAPSDFIRDIVAKDQAGDGCAHIHTRFPPEPNGYLHIGHAKSICLNFGIAREFNGTCNLRFDDTNPVKEDIEYVESITRDVEWLIAGWADHCLGLKSKGATPQASDVNGRRDFLQSEIQNPGAEPGEPFFASDYFEALHSFAVELIRQGKAYVCDLTPQQTDEYRGAPDKPGKESPWRNRTVEENLDLFARMKAGEFPDGSRSLRAKIDMASSNVWLRDPLLYRIRHTAHHHTGDRWCIYPLYDYAHCISDYIEGITHSICTLEFEVHRPLYDWILAALDLPRPVPHQYEFAKLIPSYVIVSKRKLLQLVDEGVVSDWDDPRMPTLSGLRRRGVPAAAVRNFVTSIGVTKYESLTDIAVFDHAIREELNRTSLRRLAVLRPVKIVLTNIAEGEAVECRAVNNPENPETGSRVVRLTREVFIDQDDFMEVPPPKYFRLRPGGEVRLKYACIIRCDDVIKNADGSIAELRCTAELDTRTGEANAGKKVKGTIHWVSAPDSLPAEVRLYDRLFTAEEPDADGEFMKHLNPNSLEVVQARVEPVLRETPAGTAVQFERLGYFAPDIESKPDALVFNRTISLKDGWAKTQRKG